MNKPGYQMPLLMFKKKPARSLTLYPLAAMWTGPVKFETEEPVIVPSSTLEGVTGATADEKVQDLLLQNPHASGPTMVNLIKAHGIKFMEAFPILRLKKKAECVSGSSHVAVQREASLFKMPVMLRHMSTPLRESSYRDNGIGPSKFRVVILQEGLGNLRDASWYSKEAIASAVSVFEGAKCFVNHPSASEESDRPERDVRDIAGHFENCEATTASDGRARLEADLIMLQDPAVGPVRTKLVTAIDYSKKFPEKNFVGLSINANGESIPMLIDALGGGFKVPESCRSKLEAAKQMGISEIKYVDKITDAVSCDIVTEPGAGGRVLEIIE